MFPIWEQALSKQAPLFPRVLILPLGALDARRIDERNVRLLALEQLGQGQDLQPWIGPALFIGETTHGGGVALHRPGRRLGGDEHS